MLLVVQRVWIALIQGLIVFCYLYVCVLTVLDRNVCIKGVEVQGLFGVRWGNGNWTLLVRRNGWVKVADPSLIASRRYQVSVNSASLVIRGVIFAT
jgi:hypothetical protein